MVLTPILLLLLIGRIQLSLGDGIYFFQDYSCQEYSGYGGINPPNDSCIQDWANTAHSALWNLSCPSGTYSIFTITATDYPCLTTDNTSTTVFNACVNLTSGNSIHGATVVCAPGQNPNPEPPQSSYSSSSTTTISTSSSTISTTSSSSSFTTSSSTETLASTTSSLDSSSSSLLSSTLVTSTVSSPTQSTTASTISSSSQSSSNNGSSGGGLSESDKIQLGTGIGIGLGVGLPCAVIACIQIVRLWN